jgi:hypothetical protein
VIILSGVLVVLAIALLVTGIVTGNTGHEIAGLDGLKLIYVSIAVSIVSALFLLIGVFLRRKELFGTSPASAKSSKSAAAGRTGKAARPAKAKARVGAGDETTVPPASATATEVPAETTVYVVPGRKRYHLDTCRQLAGRDKEELTFEEAHEEGFTACTACLPDTALAARAAISDAEAATASGTDSDSDERTTETLPADGPADQLPADESAEVTRTDLPIARREPVVIEPGPEPELSSATTAETTRPIAEPAETTETLATLEPAADPVPSAGRSRSLFEPPERADDAPTDTPAAAAEESGEIAAPEDDATADESADTAAHEPEDQARVPREHATRDAAHLDDDEHAEHDEHDEDQQHDEDHEYDEGHEDVAAPSPVPDEPEDTATGEQADAVAEEDVPVTDDEEHTSAEHPDTSLDEDADSPADADEDGQAAESPSIVRILSGTKRYHRVDCALIEDIAEDADDLETVSPAEAKERGCTPCLVCQPDKDSPDTY